MLFRTVFTDGRGTDTSNIGLWISILVSSAIVKPVIYGTATGLAVSEFSGIGRGYDGFTGAYIRRLLEVIAMNVAFQFGLYAFGLIGGTTGALLGLLWGLVIAAVLIVRLRTVLQKALLEGALEADARKASGNTAEAGFCPHCEMPLIPDSSFCVACGHPHRASPRLTGPPAPVPATVGAV